MHSLKNTFVAVTLLAVSFGLYHVSLTPESTIDPSQIPSIDISDGLDRLGSDGTADNQSNSNSLQSKLSAPQLDTLSLPELASNINQPPSLLSPAELASEKRLPIVSTTENNVQSIEYPTGQASKSSASSANISKSNMAELPSVSATRDQGLIDVLKSQQDFDAAMADKKTQPVSRNNALQDDEFNPDSTGPSLTETPNAATGQNNQFQHNAQPIAASNSAFNGQASSVAAPDSKSNGFDANVKQAHTEPGLGELDFNAAWPKVDQLIASGDFRTALELLSKFYRNDNLTGPQRQRLLGWLDALAGKVIFSDENHLATQPYTVGANETLADVANKWKVPAQLIYNVNQQSLPNPVALRPGAQLKMIPGPFFAELDLQAKVMTLFLGDLYAGRFPIRVGISGEPKPGKFTVLVKSETGHAWRDSNGVDYPPGSPENGYGPEWIGLSGSLCIHAVEDSAIDGHHGCIGLNAEDAKDVFAILAENSTVTIVR